LFLLLITNPVESTDYFNLICCIKYKDKTRCDTEITITVIAENNC